MSQRGHRRETYDLKKKKKDDKEIFKFSNCDKEENLDE